MGWEDGGVGLRVRVREGLGHFCYLRWGGQSALDAIVEGGVWREESLVALLWS